MLPQKLNLPMTQVQWAKQLDPIIANPVLNNIILKDQVLKTGVNVINHKLGRVLQGWRTTRVRAAATFYDQQDTNSTPQLTLVLVSTAPVTIDIEVF